MQNDSIVINLNHWIFNSDDKVSNPISLLIKIMTNRDTTTNVFRTTMTHFCQECKIPQTVMERFLQSLIKAGFIEVYKDKHYCYIACRKNEYYDFDGVETYLDKKHYVSKNGRNTPDYRSWRLSCLKRDKYTCQYCGSDKNLCVHHIKSYANYPQLSTRVSNGITLCKECHKKEHRRMKNVRC